MLDGARHRDVMICPQGPGGVTRAIACGGSTRPRAAWALNVRQSGVMVDVSSPRQLVDELIDRGLAESPATDWSVILPREWLDVLPVEADRLQRPVEDGRSGAVSCPVYRGFELVAMPLTRPVMILNDAGGYMSSLYMNTVTGQIGHDLTEIGLAEDRAD